MLALARCGEHAEAAAIGRRLLASRPEDAKLYVEVACGLALCAGAARDDAALARGYADEALAALRHAVERGWRDVGRLKVDPDLDPIRDDPGFRRLITELESPAAAAPDR
jgi:hypothetical protein